MYHDMLQAFNWLCSGQNKLAEPPQSFNSNVVVKTGLLILHGLSTGFTVVKAGMTILYRLSTSFAVVKTGLENIYWSSTGFAVVKPSTGFLAARNVLPNFYSLSTIFVVVKMALLNLCSCLNVLTEHPHHLLKGCRGSASTF